MSLIIPSGKIVGAEITGDDEKVIGRVGEIIVSMRRTRGRFYSHLSRATPAT